MTTEAQIPRTVLISDRRTIPLNAEDSRFDAGETCARCGPSARAQVKWVFPPISEFTRRHCDLYLCAHCSLLGGAQLRTTSILTVDRTPDQL
ncbi:hypothetical protein [Kribbella rubisoli]|uniref:hypothetical protein n=1 Tax=Kribbella rubisoli TaxID=3075929 RepID=UPI00102BFF88|nr:hypothetical protein [Kribbella rubisoli]